MHMQPIDLDKHDEGAGLGTAPHFVDDTDSAKAQAWEEIDVGRFMPRRIRGSYRGRALG
jgi:hypothetical protein